MDRNAYIIAFFLAMMPQTVDSKVRVMKKTLHYAIHAETREQLVAAYAKLPKGRLPGSVNDARIYFGIRRNASPLKMRSGQCRLARVVVEVRLAIILPRLRTRSVALRKRWRSYYAHVRRHEEQHARITLKYARALDRQLRVLRMPDCQSLVKQAETLQKRIWSAMMEEQQKMEIPDKFTF